MLKVEVDMFSGRPNPVWIITDETEAKRLLGAVVEAKGVTAKPGAGFTGLGFREVRVSLIPDHAPRRRGVPQRFALASTASQDFKTSGVLALRLIEAMPFSPQVHLVEHAITPLTPRLRDGIIKRLTEYLADPPRPGSPEPPLPSGPSSTTVSDEMCTDCLYEQSSYNAEPWNRPHVQPFNNCYNYACNWQTDTFAQPGRAHGALPNIITCNTVIEAALADSLKQRCHCMPESEVPRWLVALVVDPDEDAWIVDVRDYHWYHRHINGFWGHKPGRGTARNFDNIGRLITNPETCSRGSYTEFCGYFYAGRRVVIS